MSSLRDRIASREQQLARQVEHSILVPIPGFEDFLAVRYRPLSAEQTFRIESRHERLTNSSDQNERWQGFQLAAADKLVQACERICELNGDGQWHDTEYRWDVKAARELFGRDLEDEATPRTAVRAILSDPEMLILHAAKYEELRSATKQRLDPLLEGESPAPSQGAVSTLPQPSRSTGSQQEISG